MSEQLHVCVVGYGYWGPKLVRNFLAAGAYVYVCDASSAARARAIKDFPHLTGDWTRGYDSVLECRNIDAVVIATPPATHFDLALQALRAGKHVLCEKPLALENLHAQLLSDAALNAGVALMVDHTFLYHPAVQTLRAALQIGELGDRLQSFESVRVNHGLFQKDTDVFWDLAVHDVSILLHLIPERPVSVSATGSIHNPAGKIDIGVLTLQYASGFFASIHVSWLSPVKVRRLAIGGNKKTAVWNDLDTEQPLKIFGCSTQFEDNRAAYRLGDVFSPRLDNAEALRNMADDFLYVCKSGLSPVSSPRLARDVVRVLHAAQNSIEYRSPQTLRLL